MTLPRVLLVIEKYCDGNPVCGVSNSRHMLFNTLLGSGYAGEVLCFHFDMETAEFGQEGMCARLLGLCREWRPFLAVFTPMTPAIQPTGETLLAIRDELKIPLWVVMADTIGNHPEARPVIEAATGVSAWDVSPEGFWDETGKVHASFSPIDDGLFYDRGLERDWDVSFFGTLWQNTRRYEYAEYLLDNGIDLKLGGGQHVALGGDPLTPEDYALTLSRSKIVWNNSIYLDQGSRCVAIHGRVFEALASRTFLLEEENPQARRFFEEGKEYVSFIGKEDLLAKTRYYLAHDQERERIATAGWEKRRDVWNSRRFWADILGHLGCAI